MLRMLLLFVLLLPLVTHAQHTLTGPKGMINVPEAAVLESGTFMFGMHTNDEAYKLIDYGENRPSGGEYVSALTFGFLDRLNITFMLTRIFGDPMQRVGDLSSIGDRSMQVTGLILKEKKWQPAVLLNIADPFYSTNQFLTGNHILVSKTLLDKKAHTLRSTLGYGFPYLLVFAGQKKRTLASKESDYLTHLFGGIAYQYLPANLQFSLEYDGITINTGLGVTLWKRLGIQTYLQGMKYPGLGFNYTGVIH